MENQLVISTLLKTRGSRVAAGDYISYNASLPLAHPFQKLVYEIVHEECGRPPVMGIWIFLDFWIFWDLGHTLLALQAMFGM